MVYIGPQPQRLVSCDTVVVGHVDKLGFVIGMLIALGVQLCGEPLDFERDVQMLIDRFDALDARQTGVLDREDLEYMVRACKAGVSVLSI